MEEPAEAPYAMWLQDFVTDEKPPLIGALAADKISCGRLSNVIVVPVTSSAQYVRADVLPSEERSGLTGRTTVWMNMLVFRRALAGAAAEATPAAALPAPAQSAAVINDIEKGEINPSCIFIAMQETLAEEGFACLPFACAGGSKDGTVNEMIGLLTRHVQQLCE